VFCLGPAESALLVEFVHTYPCDETSVCYVAEVEVVVFGGEKVGCVYLA
jgi:hypothetical protein